MSENKVKAAAIQMLSSDSVERNLEQAERLISTAVKQGAELVVLPENFALMAKKSREVIGIAETIGEGRLQSFMATLSERYNVWMIGGSIPIRSPKVNKVYSACLVYNNAGRCVAQYNKLHLYDVHVASTGETYRESDTFVAGNDIVIVETPFGKMGLSICYDLRFPELYRSLMNQGADFIVAPSAFTKSTGKAHWSLLCRTRAVENLCYLIAPNQGGQHTNGRETYGHSMVVDPWGKVLAEVTVGEGVALATLDFKHLKALRMGFPAIEHTRFNFNLQRD